MRRIVVSLLKGGVAKSETAVSLAFGLAARGRRVLLVDTDVQAHCSDMLGMEPERGLADLVAGWDSPEGVLVEARENLWLLAGGNELAALKMEIARREMASEAVLSEALEVYEGRFDYMIMDTAPGWDTLLVNALYASQHVLSPVSMEPMALSGLVRFQERLQVIQRYKPELKLRWVVPTFVDGRVRKTAEILEQLKQRYGALVGPKIRYSAKASEAPAFGLTVFEHDPKGSAAKGYNQLTERIIQDCEQEEPGFRGLFGSDPEADPSRPRAVRPSPELLARPIPSLVPEDPAGDFDEPEQPPLAARASLGKKARPTLVEAVRPSSGATVRPSPGATAPEPEPGPELSRDGLIEKILQAKESVSPRSRAKFSWVIERLESSERSFSQTDLRALDQIIDQMIASDRAISGAAEQKPAPVPGRDGQGRPVSAPLTQRLKKNNLSPDQERIGLGEVQAAEG